MGILDRMLHDEEDVEPAKHTEKHEPPAKISKKEIITFFVIFLAALTVRIFILFNVTNPQNAGVEGWYSDVYHHWQISYLTKEVGLENGFLRLWDLKGLEYFWGATHPLVGVILMSISGSTDIVIFRLLSSFSGAFALSFLFLIVSKNWGYKAGLAAALLGIFNPVTAFNDASGMVEPLGIFIMLSAIYMLNKKPLVGGVLLALGSGTRAEYWVLSGLILLMILFSKHHSDKKLKVFVGYFVPIILYMKYLLDYTGNPIYPVWWNYMGNAAGAWQAQIPPTAEQMVVKNVYMAIALLSLFGLIYVIWKKVKGTAFLVFGFGNWFMWGVTIGMTKYLLSYLPRFWVDRIMIWPYLFLGSLIAIGLFYYIEKLEKPSLRIVSNVISWCVIFFIIVSSQILWKPIHKYYDPTQKDYENFKAIAQVVGETYREKGEGGKIAYPEFWPPLTYMLVNYEGISGDQFVSQAYDPYFYNPEPEKEALEKWITDNSLTLLITTGKIERYEKMIELYPEWFEKVSEDRGIIIYKIKVKV